MMRIALYSTLKNLVLRTGIIYLKFIRNCPMNRIRHSRWPSV